MKTGEEKHVFPYERIWEDLGPPGLVDWEDLEGDVEHYERIFLLPGVGNYVVPVVDKTVLLELAETALGREPSPRLVTQLYLLAGWQVWGEFQKHNGAGLDSQRRAIKRLERAAFKFWEAANSASGIVNAILPTVHAEEPQRLLPAGAIPDLYDLGTAAHDVCLAAGRMHRDLQPRRTGRRTVLRRDTTVRLGAQAIEAETGEPIATSRGNSARTERHFTNAGGHLLRDLFKLIEPKTDEGLILQALLRTRKLKPMVKKTHD